MSITTVPIAPVEKGTLIKLWGGVALAVLVAGGIAYAGTGGGSASAPGGCALSTPSGLGYSVTKPGTGAKPTDSDVVLVNYKGALTDGKEFDAAQRAPFPVSQVVPGFSEGLKLMQKGGSYRLCIPSTLGYGDKGAGPIPANSPLIFDVDMIDFKSMAEIQAMQSQMQQQGGAPGGAAPHGEMTPGQ
jgi:FKBP-type peptidyl-prolyl cis-trans isomerase FkpA